MKMKSDRSNPAIVERVPVHFPLVGGSLRLAGHTVHAQPHAQYGQRSKE